MKTTTMTMNSREHHDSLLTRIARLARRLPQRNARVAHARIGFVDDHLLRDIGLRRAPHGRGGPEALPY